MLQEDTTTAATTTTRMIPTTTTTTTSLQDEIAAVEKRIQQKEEQLSLLTLQQSQRHNEQQQNAATTKNTTTAATTTDDDIATDDTIDAVIQSPQQQQQQRLLQLEQEVNDLLLMQKLTEWANQTVLYNKKEEEEEEKGSRSDDHEKNAVTTTTKSLLLVDDQVEALRELGKILCQQQQQQQETSTTTTTSSSSSLPLSLSQQIYQQEFVPQHKYLRTQLVQSLRQELQQAEYPAGCEDLLQKWEQQQQQHDDDNDTSTLTKIARLCQGLTRLARIQQQVTCCFTTIMDPVQSTPSQSRPPLQRDNNNDNGDDDIVLIELCRPIVERVRFHFLEISHDRPTSTRIDRLPEWLCSYMREHVLETTAVWEVVTHIHTVIVNKKKSGGGGGELGEKYDVDLPTNFLNEMIRLMQFVLEERDYFRHPTIAGAQSKPLLLINAIQQLLEFDAYLQTLVLSSNEETEQQQQNAKQDRIIRLFDACIAGDEELFAWWLERERESIFATLFDESVPDSLPQLVSPRAELFCALIRSVRTKASVFTFSGPYLAQVASPLCEQFMEAVQESSDDLRRLLLTTVPAASRGGGGGSSSSSSKLSSDENLRKNCLSWMELINGIHLAATILSRPLDTEYSQNGSSNDNIMGEQDLIHFGQSLMRLETVFIEEFGGTFVETLLMERAKMAAYLMRCSYLVGSSSSDDHDNNERHNNRTMQHDDSAVSMELHDPKRLLSIFLDVCNHVDDTVNDGGRDDDDDDDDILSATPSSLVEVGFAARAMRDYVLNLVTDKLLQVALNTDGMTPELLQPGCMVFARDVNALFAGSLLPPLALRLLDICKLMNMNRNDLVNIGNALCGLAGQPAPLAEDAFSEDERLADEALSMMQAKGFPWMQLSDAIIVLNRRRDLS